MKGYIFTIGLLLSTFFVYGQCEEIYLKGKVSDTTKFQIFYNLMVINQTTKQGVYGRPNGEFLVYVRPEDKIAFSVNGYEKCFIVVPISDVCTIDTIIYLKPKVQQYEEIIVYPIKSLETIKKEREELSQRETRTVTGIDVLRSPITALYERFSKTAKSKQQVAKMEFQDSKDQILKNLLSAYVSYDVVYLENEQFELFIDFLNINENFLKTASDYELILYIQGKLEHYKSLHPEIFNK